VVVTLTCISQQPTAQRKTQPTSCFHSLATPMDTLTRAAALAEWRGAALSEETSRLGLRSLGCSALFNGERLRR
jgi:hypothetical protein